MSAKRRPRRKWRLLRRIARYYVRQVAAKTKARARATFGPRLVSQATADWIGGQNLRPAVQPLKLDRHVAPEDLAVFDASLGGYVFRWHMLPDPTADLRQLAYETAAEKFGPFIYSLPVHFIAAANDIARQSLPEPITQ